MFKSRSQLLNMPKIKLIIIAIALIASCANPDRDNALDPINAPVIDMREPVLDGGSVLIAWRYFAEGNALTEFVVRKVAQVQGDRFPLGSLTQDEGLGTGISGSAPLVDNDQGINTVAQIPLTADSGSGWQSLSVRDSALVAGVRLLYQVSAVSASGDLIAGVTRSFRVEGTRFELVESDPADVAIRFRWLNEPTGTTGYDLQRTAPGGATEVIFSTDDPAVRSFEDTDLTGNVVYDYVLVTRLGSGSDFSSDAIPAGLFVFDVTLEMDSTPAPGKRSFFGPGFGNVGIVITVDDVGARISEGNLASNAAHEMIQDGEGQIWMATEGGITRYRPTITPPPVRITNVTTDRERGSVSKIELPETQAYLAIEFRGSSFKTRFDEMVYVYRMDGFEEDWQRPTRERRVVYEGLPVGHYTFRVKAVDRDLTYSVSPALLSVTVHASYDRIA